MIACSTCLKRYLMRRALISEGSTLLRNAKTSIEIVYKRCSFGLLSTVDSHLIYLLN